MFVGNDKGQVLKIVNFAGQLSEGQTAPAPVLVEELQVLKFGDIILGLQLTAKVSSNMLSYSSSYIAYPNNPQILTRVKVYWIS